MKTQSWLSLVDFLWNDVREIFLEQMMHNYLSQSSKQDYTKFVCFFFFSFILGFQIYNSKIQIILI